MSFQALLDKLIDETTQRSLFQFSPELTICATIVALLLVRLFNLDRWLKPYWVALAGSLVAFFIAYVQFMYFRVPDFSNGLIQFCFETLNLTGAAGESGPFFTGLLVYDPFSLFFRLFLLLFLILIIALTVLSGIPAREDGP
ncbi:MAG: hypothetical protein IID45_13455, partial [Planctomycetes bacterium]|nr:hypothetical protein [Planctomycetota bacterium]